jgi:hypothetical protein
MKKPELKKLNAELKQEVKHLKGLLKEAVRLLSKYKDLVIHPDKPAPKKRKAAKKKKTAKKVAAAG